MCIRDSHIGFHRMLLREETAGLLAGHVNGRTFDDAVRPGKVDVLEYADGVRRGAAMGGDAAQAVPSGDHDLTGQQVADELCTHRIQRAALAGEHIAIVQLAHAQRPEAMG